MRTAPGVSKSHCGLNWGTNRCRPALSVSFLSVWRNAIA